MKKRNSPICFKKILKQEYNVNDKHNNRERDSNKYYSEDLFIPQKYYKPLLY